MNNQLNNLIKKNDTKSIIECIDFLYSIGYSLEENYKIAHKLFDLKININTEGLKGEELFFIEYLNNCEIIIKANCPDSIFYIKNEEIRFLQNLKNKSFWCSYYNVWLIFETKYQCNYEQIQAFIKDMLKKHLRLGGVTPFCIA